MGPQNLKYWKCITSICLYINEHVRVKYLKSHKVLKYFKICSLKLPPASTNLLLETVEKGERFFSSTTSGLI